MVPPVEKPDDTTSDPISGADATDVPRLEDANTTTPADDRVAEMLAHTIDVGVLAGAVEQQEPADAADTLETLDDAEARDVLEEMEDEAAAQALAEMQPALAEGVIEDLLEDDPAYAARLFELMAPDDAVDLLQFLDAGPRSQLLTLIQDEPAEQLEVLAAYDRESAGGMMTTDVLTLRGSMTIGDAIEHIRGIKPSEETQYALVIDAKGRLKGIITLRQILLIDNNEIVSEHMETELDVIRPDLDREEVAHSFDRYDYSILPVVDDNDVLLGLVTVDDVIDIIREEQTEDVQKVVGAGKGEAVYSSVGEKIRGRLSWLTGSLVMMCGSASVIIFWEEIIDEYLLLAFLLPVIAAVVGNGGQQAMMVTLRGIVLEEVRRDRVWPLLLRESMVGLFNGVTLGVLIYLGVWGMHAAGLESANTSIGKIAGVAMAGAMTVATLCGSGIPLLMRRVGIDPAMASSIILIMITDAVSFITLLTLTWVLLAGASGGTGL